MSASSHSSALAEQMRLLRRGYLEKLSDKLTLIENLRHQTAPNADPLDAASSDAGILFADELIRLVHSLAGSGATFGFPSISEQAKRTEAQLLQWQKDEAESSGEIRLAAARAWNSSATKSELEQLCAVLSETMRAELAGDETQADELVSQVEGAAKQTIRPLFLLEEVPGDAEELMHALRAFGWEVRAFATPSEVRAASAKQECSALLVQSRRSPLEANFEGENGHALRELLTIAPNVMPLMWICERGDLEARLEAVRLGARAFYVAPAPISELIESLEHIAHRDDREPYRVLLVDDDPNLARLYALMLRGAGCEVLEINSPLQIMAPLVEFAPDLILMDVYMPEVSGVDLAVAIVQQEPFAHVPIVYLSSEAELERQIEILERAGDEFLTKPISARLLTAVVRARAARGRVQRRRVERDSLTGTLDLPRFMEQLSAEVERVERVGHTSALVLVDVDDLKTVNVEFGRAAGDRVLKSLAHTLLRRLRHNDVVGRYGGEEFALILSGATGEQAHRVVEELRTLFASTKHQIGGREFSATFSAGIATAPPWTDATHLSEAADDALQLAKMRGCNCVVWDDSSTTATPAVSLS